MIYPLNMVVPHGQCSFTKGYDLGNVRHLPGPLFAMLFLFFLKPEARRDDCDTPIEWRSLLMGQKKSPQRRISMISPDPTPAKTNPNGFSLYRMDIPILRS